MHLQCTQYLYVGTLSAYKIHSKPAEKRAENLAKVSTRLLCHEHILAQAMYVRIRTCKVTLILLGETALQDIVYTGKGVPREREAAE